MTKPIIVLCVPSATTRYLTTPLGLQWMCVEILVFSFILLTVHFPMWGGMLFGPTEGVSEEDYYIKVIASVVINS